MGDITQDSGSSRKSFRGRIPINASDATKTIRQKLNQFSEEISHKAENMMRGASLQKSGREASVYAKGVRQLNDHGYDTFNIDDGAEIFISKVPNNALFNDGEPVLVRATDGNYVGRVNPFKAEAPVDDRVQPVAGMSLFQNVPRATSSDKQITGIVGVVNSDGQVAVQPVNNDFLSKMARPAKAEEASIVETHEETVIEAEVSEPVYEASDFMSRMVRPSRHVEEEAPIIEEVVDEAPVEEPVVDDVPAIEEIPVIEQAVEDLDNVEAPVVSEEVPVLEQAVEPETDDYVNEECEAEPLVAPVTGIMEVDETAEKKREDFIIEAEDEDVDASEDDSGVIESDDYSWFDDAEQDVVADDVCEIEPVTEDISVVDETPVVAPVTAFIEKADEIPVEPVSVEEKIEATPALPESAVVPEGLYIEGNAPSNAATSTLDKVSAVPTQATSTSAVAQVQKATVIPSLTADGEALPPMSDPVRKRPSSMRFRFDNGVLMNVGSKNRGSEEGPRGPLE